MFPTYRLALMSLFLILLGCGGDGDSNPAASAPQTRTELISHTWRVLEATIGDLTLPGTPAAPPFGFEDLSVTFAPDGYSFTFPGGICGLPAGVHTIAGPWRLEANETQIVLDRSNADVGETDIFSGRLPSLPWAT